MFIRRENLKQYVKLYPIVSILIAINLIVYVITLLPGIGNTVFYGGMHVNLYVGNGEFWRIITSMFLHSGFLHILFNMFSLYVFGPEMEKIAGKARFITIYFLSGIFGNIATYLTQDSTYASVGASGAIFGIFGAFVALVFYTYRTLPILRQIILPIVIISVVLTFIQPDVNVSGHLGGLATGFLLGLFYFNRKNIIRWRMNN